MKAKLFVLTLLSVLVVYNLFAQEFNYDFKGPGKKFRFKFDFDKETHPYIELNYGLTQYKHKSFYEDFAKVGNAEIKLGSRNLDYWDKENITEMKDKYLFFGVNTIDLKDKNAVGLQSELINFGLGFKHGYGYQIGAVNITPYFGGAFVWNKLNMKQLPDTTLGGVTYLDYATLKDYNKTVKFGQRVEGGLSVGINKMFFVDASYQANVVYPKFMTWKYFGSLILEGMALGFADEFVDEIIDSTPEAAPIISFLLKNGIAYGAYMLQRDKMNYPFNSGKPLTYETFKLGISIVF